MIGIYGILASATVKIKSAREGGTRDREFTHMVVLQGSLGLMRLYKLVFWLFLVFILTIWEAVDFVLALVNRSKSLDACNEANPDQAEGSGDQSVSVGDYKATLLGMQLGNTYGLANCAQAVQAGVIGLAILLFVGQLTMVS